MARYALFLLIFLATTTEAQVRLRGLADTIGYSHTHVQMDSLMKRIDRAQGVILKKTLNAKKVTENEAWRCAIAPHDDYNKVGYLYPLVLKNIKAKTVILFGVAHRAAAMKLEDKLIFDSYTHWRGPYGNIKVSTLREAITAELPAGSFSVNDSMQTMEHSVEAELPFIQYYNKNVEIISILVPYMSFDKMNELAQPLAKALAKIMKDKKLEWGKDMAMVFSSDAVHYGDDDWNGRNFAFFGADTAGYNKAVEHEHKIMDDCFKEEVTSAKIKTFTEYTVKKENHKDYQWTWCGRYSVPMGMLTALYLQQTLKAAPLKGCLLGYTTSIDHPLLKLDDLGLSTTTKASLRHWVGYTSVGFK